MADTPSKQTKELALKLGAYATRQLYQTLEKVGVAFDRGADTATFSVRYRFVNKKGQIECEITPLEQIPLPEMVVPLTLREKQLELFEPPTAAPPEAPPAE